MLDERDLQSSDPEKMEGTEFVTEETVTENVMEENSFTETGNETVNEEFSEPEKTYPEPETAFAEAENNAQQEYDYEEYPEEHEEIYEQRTPQGNREIPRWNPNPEDYSSEPKPPKRKKSQIVIAIVVAAALVVGSIATGVFIGINRVHRVEEKLEAQIQEEKDNQTKITTTSPSSGQDVSTDKPRGYVLTDVSGIVEEVLPSVVSITSRSLVDAYPDYFSFFFGNRNSDSSNEKKEIESGLGSGTIIAQNENELLILTSFHVVDNCSSLYVTFMDENSVDGYVKSADEEKDIAIVAIPLSDIPEDTLNYVKIATLATEQPAVGEGVIVIGNALGYGMSVTTGIVSATDRELKVDGKTLNVLQTDAAINEGNSGGCVLNADGEVIGISEAKIIVTSVEGMCYAIPIHDNTELIQNLLNEETQTENFAPAQGAYLGIQGRDVSRYNAEKYGIPEGVYVAGTVRGGGAEQAGIMKGDIITRIDETSATTMTDLQEILAHYNPGDEVVVTIMRESAYGYEEIQLDVTLTEVLS